MSGKGYKVAEPSKIMGDLLNLQDLMLMQQALLHDLSSKKGRKHSAAALKKLFQGLQTTVEPAFTLASGVKYHHVTVSDTEGEATRCIRIDDRGEAMRSGWSRWPAILNLRTSTI